MSRATSAASSGVARRTTDGKYPAAHGADRGSFGARGRNRVRHVDRRARQGGRRASLPRGGHRGARRQRAVREGLGAARGRPATSRACRPPSRIRSSVRTGDPRVDLQSALAMLAPEWGLSPADRHHRRAGARGPRARVGDGALVRGAVGARRGPPADPAGGGGQGHLDPRALPDPLARRGRPAARQGDRRLLDLAPPSTA